MCSFGSATKWAFVPYPNTPPPRITPQHSWLSMPLPSAPWCEQLLSSLAMLFCANESRRRTTCCHKHLRVSHCLGRGGCGVGMLVAENENSHLLVTPNNQTFREAHRVSGRAFKAPWLYRLWSSSKCLHEADTIRNRMHFTQGH